MICMLLILKRNGNNYPTRTRNIKYLKADGSYTSIKTKDGTEFVENHGLYFFEDAVLATGLFVKLGRALIVNSKFIRYYNHEELFIDGEEKPFEITDECFTALNKFYKEL